MANPESQFKRDFAAKWNSVGFTPRKLMLLTVGVSALDVEGYAAVNWRQLPVDLRNGLLAAAYKEEE